MTDALMTVELPPGAVSLEEAAKRLGVAPEQLDAEFGLVPVDPDNNLYSVMVDERAAERAGRRAGAEGPFSNPRIEPFGPG
jgi:hypothetical protein